MILIAFTALEGANPWISSQKFLFTHISQMLILGLPFLHNMCRLQNTSQLDWMETLILLRSMLMLDVFMTLMTLARGLCILNEKRLWVHTITLSYVEVYIYSRHNCRETMKLSFNWTGLLVESWLFCIQYFPCLVSFQSVLGIGAEVWMESILYQFIEAKVNLEPLAKMSSDLNEPI